MSRLTLLIFLTFNVLYTDDQTIAVSSLVVLIRFRKLFVCRLLFVRNGLSSLSSFLFFAPVFHFSFFLFFLMEIFASAPSFLLDYLG